MSRKSHPIGLRLGSTQNWKYSLNLLNLQGSQQKEFFIWRWFVGFCWVNYYYLFDFIKLHESRAFSYFYFLFYSDPLLPKSPRPKKLLIGSVKYFYRSKKTRMKKARLFRQKFLRLFRLYLYLKFFKVKTKTRTYNCRLVFFRLFNKKGLPSTYLKPFYRIHNFAWNGAKRYFRKNKMTHLLSDLQLIKSNITKALYQKRKSRVRLRLGYMPLRILHGRFHLLRLKLYLESRLTKYLSKHVVLLISNLNDSLCIKYRFTPYKSSYNHKNVNGPRTNVTTRSENWKTLNKQVFSIFKELKTQFNFEFPKHFIFLSYYGCLYGRPEPLLQWLVYSIRSVRKHSLTLSHQKILDLFTTCLEHFVHLVGLMRGFRLEVRGKINGSERTKKTIVVSGVPLARQSLHEVFQYHFEHIPTYSGALGVRLWLKY